MQAPGENQTGDVKQSPSVDVDRTSEKRNLSPAVMVSEGAYGYVDQENSADAFVEAATQISCKFSSLSRAGF